MPWNQSSVLEQREELVLALLNRRESVRKICQKFGVSRQTAYKFRARMLQQGRHGLRDLSRGPKRKPSVLRQRYHQAILTLRRRHGGWGARKLLFLLRLQHPRRHLPAERTVERWLAQAGLARPQRRRRRVRPVPLHKPKSARRSNDVWTFDWKGWFRTGDGTKIEPLTIRDRATCYQLWSCPLSGRGDQAVREVCRQLFCKHGMPKAIRTDRGGPFCGSGPYGLTTLSLWWYRLGIAVEFVQRSAGLDNNSHEQMHGVMQRETASPPAPNKATQLRRLRRWEHIYNHLRPHEDLGDVPPAWRYRSKPGKIPPLLVPSYPEHWLVRTVGRDGKISLASRRHHVGKAFAGLEVGCQPIGSDYQVHYDKLQLVRIPPALQAKPGRRKKH